MSMHKLVIFPRVSRVPRPQEAEGDLPNLLLEDGTSDGLPGGSAGGCAFFQK